MKKFLSITIAVIISLCLSAKQGYEIKVKVSCYANKKITLAYHYGKKQYIKQEVTANSKGEVVFKGNKKLPTGLYILVFPNSKSIETIVEEQFFSVVVPCSDKKEIKEGLELNSGISFTGSAQNSAFYGYLSFLELKREEQKLLNKKIKLYKKSKDKQAELKKAEADFAKLDAQVEAEQDNVIAKYKGKMLSKFLLAQKQVKVPESNNVYQKKYGKDWKYYYYKHHYWDNIDFSFAGLLYSSVLHSKADNYLEKVTIQIPDSVFASADLIIQKSKSNKTTYRYFIAEMLNKYAKSKTVCFDAVYVKIANKYHRTGIANWIDGKQLKNVISDADRLSKVLCGQKAPKIVTKIESSKSPSLYNVKAKYTVVVFWSASSDNRWDFIKELKKTYEKYKGRGVEFYTIEIDKYGPYWAGSFKGQLPWINLHKTNIKSNVLADYNAVAPLIYILDKDKKILVKRIGVKQIASVLSEEFRRKKK